MYSTIAAQMAELAEHVSDAMDCSPLATAMLGDIRQARLLEVAEALLGKPWTLLEFKEACPAEPGGSTAKTHKYVHKKYG